MISTILTDIEGTTSSLSFVRDVLFPYAQDNIEEFLNSKYQKSELVTEQVKIVAESHGLQEDDLDAVSAQLQEWMRTDTKATPLKILQGLIWKTGYKRGNFKGHVYSDVANALWRWQSEGIDLYVYSSGSVEAQRLLFGYSMAGDLSRLFKGFFDTRTGPKKEVSSYIAIASVIGRPAQDILFLSDVPEELSAASEAGMQVTQLVRDESTEWQDQFQRVKDFSEISLKSY